MRVIAGTWRGRKIAEPKGRDVTRPTTDRVREACASMADSALEAGIAGARVLDAFGGSGALGIEMLSRGAAFARFVDIDRQAATLIRRNLTSLEAPSGTWGVTLGDAPALAERGRLAGGPFDLVLIDPPYALGPEPAERLLGALARGGSIAPGAVAVIERADRSVPARPAGFEPIREKRYGSTAVDVLRYTASASRVQEADHG